MREWERGLPDPRKIKDQKEDRGREEYLLNTREDIVDHDLSYREKIRMGRRTTRGLKEEIDRGRNTVE